jgi:hypothetical protein
LQRKNISKKRKKTFISNRAEPEGPTRILAGPASRPAEAHLGPAEPDRPLRPWPSRPAAPPPSACTPRLGLGVRAYKGRAPWPRAALDVAAARASPCAATRACAAGPSHQSRVLHHRSLPLVPLPWSTKGASRFCQDFEMPTHTPGAGLRRRSVARA